ncbi:MAG TPA: molybdopterin dinucleotide binding domain-containing protein [Acidobacteriota bacterium]|nr:molybdopterin dinucleotide binding domain-containing protein [Acidobacteriota bacterium]
MRATFISGRSTRQGMQINIGKDNDEYRKITTTLSMNEEDMAALQLSPGMRVKARSQWGEALFECDRGDLPSGMVFAVYGPPTSALMGGETDGTGMPTQKGWEVEIEAATQENTSS